ncbi:MAG TPA: 2,3,4,5-tetrahydropyridine-2,6-dicarboxylate N-succinyltransferase [Gemmatimonadetes bacterium]|jgi:2,3,4,5-tetrahydropyridine-2-carboxylate N-succinyltransferase|nr:2,3,4,5-tetrahydropyridine-2,6-dicarboxylate N-succinyltransferase [Gemmatimonadota bacterium]
MTTEEIKAGILGFAGQTKLNDQTEAKSLVEEFLDALDTGVIRSAEKQEGEWKAVGWVKSGILLTFQIGQNSVFPNEPSPFFDKDTLPLRDTRGLDHNIRIVPGGTSVRRGSFLGTNVIIMPPAFVNIGAYVDDDTMIDSHALVGSCAQIGRKVHLSAGCQIGGVLEPIGMRPVIIEDEALIGGNTGVFEGTLVGEGTVLAPGVQLTSATTVYDLVRETTYRSQPGKPLTIPAGAVVVPGSRPAKGIFATEKNIQLYAPVIVKYRDGSTDAATALEEALR